MQEIEISLKVDSILEGIVYSGRQTISQKVVAFLKLAAKDGDVNRKFFFCHSLGSVQLLMKQPNKEEIYLHIRKKLNALVLKFSLEALHFFF